MKESVRWYAESVPWRARNRVGGYRSGFLSCLFLLRHLFFFCLLDKEKKKQEMVLCCCYLQMVYWIQSVLAWQCKWLIRYLLLIISVFHFVLLILHLHCLSFLLGKSLFCLFCFFFYREGRRKKPDKCGRWDNLSLTLHLVWQESQSGYSLWVW